MVQAVSKYKSYPVVNQRSTVRIMDVQPPVIYICNIDQFNYRYNYMHRFFYVVPFMVNVPDYLQKSMNC